MHRLHAFSRSLALTLGALALAAAAHAAPAVFTRAQVAPSRLPAALAARPESRATLLEMHADALAEFRDAGGGVLALPAAGGELRLRLVPFDDLLGPGAVVTTDERGTHPVAVEATVYRGVVEGEEDSWAVVTLSRAGAHGIVERGGHRLLLAPAEPGAAALHALGDEDAMGEVERTWSCGTNETVAALVPNGLPKPPATPLAPMATTQRLWFDLAVDCDWEIYNNKFGGSLTNATNYMLTLLGTVSLIYERDLNTRLRTTYLNFWTTASDPYSATSTSPALSEFQNWWNANRGSVPRSVAHLVSGRNLGGGIAFLNGLCGSSAYGVSAIDAVYSYPTATSTWDVNVIAHELGHNFGSPHTHSCFWQDNGYVGVGALVDTCAATENGSCNSAPRGLPAGGRGTIMSYCHLLAGVANGIRLDFHPTCILVLRAGAESAICRTAPFPQPPRALVFTPTSTGGNLTWTAGTTAGLVRYDVFRSALPLDTNPTKRGSSLTTAFADTGFGTWYYKVRAIRTTDSTDWTGETRGTLCALGTAATTATGSTPITGVRGDFDEDGIEDLALAALGAGGVDIHRGNGAAGAGNGTFGAATLVTTGSSPIGIAKGDFDADGITDLAVGNIGDGTVVTLRGGGTGGVGTGTFGAGATITTGGEPWAIETGDFDEDGVTDLVVALGGAGAAVVRGQGAAGVGDGTFAAPVALATGASFGVCVNDFNDDGIFDLAFATSSGARVLLGNGTAGKGDGTFAAPATYACQSAPYSIAAGDFNADGITDLAVGNSSSASVSVLRGNGAAGVGNGTFAAAVHHPAGATPYGVTVADWNSDGAGDLIVANSSTARTVSVLVANTTGGVPTGTFATPQAFGTVQQPRSVVLGDFNEDGAPDVVTPNQTSATFSRLAGSCGPLGSTALAVTAPNGGDTWLAGEEKTITWTKGPGVVEVDVELSVDGGANWRTLARHQHGTQFTMSVVEPFTTTARVRVVDPVFPNRQDASDADFTIGTAAGVDGAPGAAFALTGAWPNPARRALAVAFALPDGAPAALELLDLAGRRVAFREVGSLGAGSHRASLVDGRELRPGVYVVRLSRGGRSQSMKVAFVR